MGIPGSRFQDHQESGEVSETIALCRIDHLPHTAFLGTMRSDSERVGCLFG
jgi:hypothetical protein